MFQSTRPRGARRASVVYINVIQKAFQSTRPRGARHHEQFARRVFGAVSIHAPARGATGALEQDGLTGAVSIHAPARGATPVS